jgi:hypothetical protein
MPELSLNERSKIRFGGVSFYLGHSVSFSIEINVKY